MIGVLTYSLYEVLIKKFGTRKGDPATIPNGARLVGYIGINTVLWIWPIIPILHYSGLEPFEWPKQGELVLRCHLSRRCISYTVMNRVQIIGVGAVVLSLLLHLCI